MNIIDILQERGLIEQITSPEIRNLAEKPLSLYLGFDPTADSLHLGHLLGIMVLAWFQKQGHQVYALVGGATGRVGDPSGKSHERPILSEQELNRNVDRIDQFLQKILSFPEGKKPILVNNADWLGKMSLIDFLRDVGKYFRVGVMLSKESVKMRIQSEEGISFTEFSYQALQGYDFYFLHQKYGVSLQIGGSDQWGNITAGIEYARKIDSSTLYGLTMPLLTRSDGKKFGKSEGGAVWLSADKLSSYHFYQYLISIPDADVISLLKKLTFLPLEKIAEIEKRMKEPGYVPNEAQKILAEEVTLFVHGQEALSQALRVTKAMMPGGSEMVLSKALLEELSLDLAPFVMKKEELIGMKFVDFCLKVGLVPSKAEATRLVKNGGAYLNNAKVLDPLLILKEDHLIEGVYLLVSSGKKKRILVKVEI